jgi:hypothetical protein
MMYDVVEARGAFQLPARSVSHRTIQDILEPDYDVDYSSVAHTQYAAIRRILKIRRMQQRQ